MTATYELEPTRASLVTTQRKGIPTYRFVSIPIRPRCHLQLEKRRGGTGIGKEVASHPLPTTFVEAHRHGYDCRDEKLKPEIGRQLATAAGLLFDG